MNYQRRAIAALECPLDWRWLLDELGADPASNIGAIDWLYRCHSVGVSVDDKAFIRDHANGVVVDADRAVAINLEEMRLRALVEYEKGVGRLYKLPFVRPSDQAKHFVAGQSKDDIVRRSRKGISYFFRDYTEAELRWAFWQWLTDYYDPTRVVANPHMKGELERYAAVMEGEDCLNPVRRQGWLDLLEGHKKRIAFDTLKEIGASRGETTTCVCVDIGSNHLHAYPVSALQAAEFMHPDVLWTSKTLW